MSVPTKAADGKDANASDKNTAAAPKGAGMVPLQQRGALYTMTAREGVNAAELVNASLAKKTVGKATPRRAEVAAPDGPSTSGGKHARQTIRLVPISGGGAPVMCGYLDVGQKTVELRGYRGVAQQFKERFGANLDVTLEEYTALLKDLETTFNILQYKVTVEVEAPAAQRAQLATDDETPQRSPIVSVVLIALAVLTLVGVGISIFER